MMTIRCRLALALIVVGLLSGCAQPRSRASFCHTLAQEKQRYLDKYEARLERIGRAGNDDLSSLLSAAVGTSVEAFGDVTVTFDKLAKVAPEEIQPDVEAIRDALERQRSTLKDVASDPLGALAGSLTSGLAAMGSWERVSRYIDQNCRTERSPSRP